MTTLTNDEWTEKYKPVNESPVEWDELPKDIHINHLWTQVDGENDTICICAGNHLVNRQGYWWTENPHTYEEVVEIVCERAECVTILWGGAPLNNAFEPDQKPVNYYFDTEEEVVAFLRGIDEMDGWMDYEIIEDGES